jgi:pantoate kinase
MATPARHRLPELHPDAEGCGFGWSGALALCEKGFPTAVLAAEALSCMPLRLLEFP